MMLNPFACKALKVIGVLVAAAAIVPVLLVAIIGFDDELTPAALRYRAEWPATLPRIEDNGFYSLAGHLRPAAEDTHAFGVRWYATLVKGQPDDEKLLQTWREQNLPAPSMGAWACHRGRQADGACIKAMLENRDAIEAFGKQHALLNGRFEHLLRFPAMTEPSGYMGMSTPMIPHVQPMFALSQARSVFSAHAGDTRAALDEAALRWRFALKLEAGAATLITKMIGVAMIQTEQSLLSALLAAGKFTSAEAQRVAVLLAEYDAHEHSMARMLHSECRMSSNLYATLLERVWDVLDDGEPVHWADRVLRSAWAKMIYRANRTLNDHAELCDETSAFSGLPPDQMMAAFAQRRIDSYGHRDVSWKTLRNPIGRVLVRVAPPDYGDYAIRALDAKGLNRLVRAQALIAAGEPPEAVLKRIELADPYTGKALAYEAVSRSLTFELRQRRTDGVSNLRAAVLPPR